MRQGATRLAFVTPVLPATVPRVISALNPPKPSKSENCNFPSLLALGMWPALHIHDSRDEAVGKCWRDLEG